MRHVTWRTMPGNIRAGSSSDLPDSPDVPDATYAAPCIPMRYARSTIGTLLMCGSETNPFYSRKCDPLFHTLRPRRAPPTSRAPTTLQDHPKYLTPQWQVVCTRCGIGTEGSGVVARAKELKIRPGSSGSHKHRLGCISASFPPGTTAGRIAQATGNSGINCKLIARPPKGAPASWSSTTPSHKLLEPLCRLLLQTSFSLPACAHTPFDFGFHRDSSYSGFRYRAPTLSISAPSARKRRRRSFISAVDRHVA